MEAINNANIMTKLFLNFILVLWLLVGSFFIFQVLPKSIQVDNNLKEITVGQTKFKVEIANTPSLQVRGLSGHKALLENEGMLFVFDKPITPGFWMKDMNFSLDIIWISSGKVVDVLENLSPDDSPNRKIYYPSQLVDNVLEVASGTILKNNIKIGDDIK